MIYRRCTLIGRCAVTALLLAGFPSTVHAQVRNAGFGSRGPLAGNFSQQNVETYRRDGWKCPDAGVWPQWWGLYGKGGVVEFPASGGVRSDGYARLGGKGVFLTGYHGLKLEGDQIYTIWARGRGKLVFHALSYGTNDAGKTVQVTKPGEAAAGRQVKVASDAWVRYRHVLSKTPALTSVHPWVGVEAGVLDIDEVEILPATPALALLVSAEADLYGTGALIEDKDLVAADAVFAERRKLYQDAVAAHDRAKGTLDTALAESLAAELEALAPYVLTDGLTAVRAQHYNAMIALTQVLNRLGGKKPARPAVITATAVAPSSVAYVPGQRPVRENALMVKAIALNKILYEEGETATAKVTLCNTTAAAETVALTARQHVDLDPASEVARGSLAVPAGGEAVWTFRYDVGPETYGRALEVTVADGSGRQADRWQEYYQVAKEWLRVQMPCSMVYNNQQHYFAAEPTDWGIQPTEAEMWIAGQPGYRISSSGLKGQIAHHQRTGKKVTFYQNASFGGIMGYEEMRKHPEYVLYDENGQFGTDPVYGGYPNPMELASPIEIGPKRQAKKPYLDRQLTPWQHAPANWAAPGCIEYGAECIRDYAKLRGYDGVFIDGTITINKGYGYDGRVNLPDAPDEVARMNARIQNAYHRILKAENPNFGTWYNFADLAVRHYRTLGTQFAGAGLEAGESAEWIRALHDWKNVSCLDETVGQFGKGDSPWHTPAGHLKQLCDNRDYIVQSYGGNVSAGYINIPIPMDLDKPGPSRWGWAAANCFMAQILATQSRVVTWALPSLEPAFQFQTRYSRFLWAPDIKVVPIDAVTRTLAVESPEPLWWQQLVYRRDTPTGHDLIVHLVRIPPFAKWDLDWVDEPAPLAGLKLTAHAGDAKIESAVACRPYQFDEPQQTVEQPLAAPAQGGKVTVTVPPFRYHTMVVLRMACPP